MLTVVQHTLTDSRLAFVRGERLKRGDGAPPGARVLQFLPSRDGRLVTCLWQGESVEDVQSYVDDTLGDASVNVCYPVADDAAFAEMPPGLARPPAGQATA